MCVCGSAGKESTCNLGDLALIPGLGRSSGEGKGYPLQYSSPENSMDCVVHGVAKSWTWLRDFFYHSVCMCYSLSHVQLCISVDCSPPGSSVHVILQARILEWFAISFSKESSQLRDWTWVSCIAGGFLTHQGSPNLYKEQHLLVIWLKMQVELASHAASSRFKCQQALPFFCLSGTLFLPELTSSSMDSPTLSYSASNHQIKPERMIIFFKNPRNIFHRVGHNWISCHHYL